MDNTDVAKTIMTSQKMMWEDYSLEDIDKFLRDSLGDKYNDIIASTHNCFFSVQRLKDNKMYLLDVDI